MQNNAIAKDHNVQKKTTTSTTTTNHVSASCTNNQTRSVELAFYKR